MNVKLVSWTQFNTEIQDNVTSLMDIIAYVARVSNPSNQSNVDTGEKLVNYLMKNKHFSPLEMVDVCLEIVTTRDIARQILRHRSFFFQEFSQRYADPTKDLAFELREARLQDAKNRQNSVETDNVSLHQDWLDIQEGIANECKDAYQWAISNGIAKEVARSVLPEGLTESKLYMKGSIRSWVHYIQLRCANGTQKEHQLVALACKKEIAKVFPAINNIPDLSKE